MLHVNAFVFMKCSFFNDRLYPRNDSICYHDVFISSTTLYFWCNKRTKKNLHHHHQLGQSLLCHWPSSTIWSLIWNWTTTIIINTTTKHHHKQQRMKYKRRWVREKNESIQKRHTHTRTNCIFRYIHSIRKASSNHGRQLIVVQVRVCFWIKKRKKHNSYVNRFSRCKSIYCFCFLFFFG